MTTSMVCLRAAPIGDTRTPPSEFRIFRRGLNASERGSFLLDDEACASIMAEYVRHAKPLILDFNHASTFAEPTPEQGIAAGQFVPEVRADGLWATAIKWTDRAREYLSRGEYRFYSPYFNSDPKTGRILRLINCALTNLPALNNLEGLVAASTTAQTGGSPMQETEAQRKFRRLMGFDDEAKQAAFDRWKATNPAPILLSAQPRAWSMGIPLVAAQNAGIALAGPPSEAVALRVDGSPDPYGRTEREKRMEAIMGIDPEKYAAWKATQRGR